jgi:hypothetical protein
MTPEEQAQVDDLRAQLAEGAETLGRERALWIDTSAKQQVVVDAVYSSGSFKAQAVAVYQDEKGQG